MTDFWEEENSLEDLNDVLDDITEWEREKFLDKWGEAPVTSPLRNFNFKQLLDQLRSPEMVHLIGPEGNPAEVTPLLKSRFGQLTEPLVDYVNMVRRTNLRRAIETYLHLGYLKLVMSESGEARYSLTDTVPDRSKQDVVRCLVANARF